MNGIMLELDSGRYQLTERRGSGHFGEVLSGMDTHLERPVAVKLFEEDAEFEDVFREARVHARRMSMTTS
jgi:serine/threonine protein kinase